MAFYNRLKRRQPLDRIVGFSGDTLGEQLDKRQLPFVEPRSDGMMDGRPGTGFDYSQPYPTMETRPETVQRDLDTAARLGQNIDIFGGRSPDRMSGIASSQVNPFQQRLLQPTERPRQTYNTTLTPEEEQAFTQWKQQYAPNDSGEDYDLRGAFQAGLQPDPQTGHWPDTFKKPNHPTFSNQSRYAVDSDAAKAGTWNGNTFVPPQTGSFQQRLMQQPPETQAAVDAERPRQVNPFAQRLFSPTRERIADPTTFDTAHLRELEAKKDPTWERILNATAAGITSATQGGAPIKRIPTRRERDIATVENRLGRDVALQNAQTKREAAEMVDVDVPDGHGGMIHTQVPRAKATAAIQANTRIKQAQDRAEQAKYKPVYMKDAQGRNVKSTPQPDGAPDKVEVITNSVKTVIPNTEWIDGTLKVWNTDTKRFDDARDTNNNVITSELKTPVTVEIGGKRFRMTPNQAGTATALSERFNITEDRAERAETAAAERDYRTRAAKAADLVGKIDGAKEAMAAAKAKLDKRPNDADALEEFRGARAYAIQAAKELGEGYGDLYETGTGSDEFQTPYYKKRDVQPPSAPTTRRPQPTPPSGGGGGGTGSGGSFNLGAWKADHPNATKEQIKAQRAKAKARNLSIVE